MQSKMVVEDIRAEKLRKLLRTEPRGLEIIDVREKAEFKTVRIKGSKSIPMSQLMSRLGEINWKKKVVFVCRSGSRSKVMAEIVSARKGRKVVNLRYGIHECQEGGEGGFLGTRGTKSHF